MESLRREWNKLKGMGTSQLDPAVKERKLELLRGMKDDLVGILDFLQRQGIYLDDHYATVRSLVANL